MSTPESGVDAAAPEPELTRSAEATTAVIYGVVAMSELPAFFDASFGTLAGTLAAQGIEITGPAFGLYHGIPGATVDLEVGFATDRPVRPEGDVVPGSLPGGRVARLTHRGAFDGLSGSWQRLGSWIQAQGLTPAAACWEVYVTKPTPDMDPRDLRTDLYWPVAG